MYAYAFFSTHGAILPQKVCICAIVICDLCFSVCSSGAYPKHISHFAFKHLHIFCILAGKICVDLHKLCVNYTNPGRRETLVDHRHKSHLHIYTFFFFYGHPPLTIQRTLICYTYGHILYLCTSLLTYNGHILYLCTSLLTQRYRLRTLPVYLITISSRLVEYSHNLVIT